MTIAQWLTDAMQKLGDAGVDSPRRDALVLLEDTIDKDRAWVLSHPEYSLQCPTLETLDSLIERRINREPLAYIRGKAWFYKRFFTVTSDTLIPRPESESFIELIKEIKPASIVDVGTGSGALAITAKLELPDSRVTATDISKEALKIAKQNAKTHDVEIEFLHGSLLEPIYNLKPVTYNLLMANLPYVPEDLITSPEIALEPAQALFSGKDGLDHYREFWQQITDLSNKPTYILTESLESQHEDVEKLAVVAGYKLQKTDVLVQLFKN